MDLKQLPKNIHDDLIVKFTELLELKANEDRIKELRIDLYEKIKAQGFNADDEIQAVDLGITIKLATNNFQKIDRELLIEQGVSEEVIEQATLISKSREHIRINQIKELPITPIQTETGVQTGVQIANK
tara:strand:- start:10643 stop:11029 length:387 start_codon:yes stop_codon:yes gene_type:complete